MQASQDIHVNGKTVSALFDTGSRGSFVDYNFVKLHSFKIYPATGNVSMATTSLSSEILGYCPVNIYLNGETYSNVKLAIMNNLCKQVIIGLDFLKLHKIFTIEFGGDRSNFSVCSSASSAIIDPPSLFIIY